MSTPLPNSGLETTAPVFAALGDPTRLRILARLGSSQSLSITDLAEGASVTRQAITKHLHVLQGAGLVKGAKHGREQRWQLKPKQLQEARRQLDLISRQWEQALHRLKAAVENKEEA